MNRSVIQAAILSLGLLAAASCTQSDIFSKISRETKPIPPLIPGSPSNMVVVNRTYNDVAVPIMYVASGKLHWYAKTSAGKPKWNSKEYPIKQPGGKIMSLAVDKKNNRLYALCINNDGVDSSLKYIESGGKDWKTISLSGAGNIQSIYAAPDPETDRLFAGVQRKGSKGSLYDIYYLQKGSSKLERLEQGLSSILSGAAYRDGIHYLCTQDTQEPKSAQGNGIYKVNENNGALSATLLEESAVTHPATGKESSPEKNRNFMGMIKLEDGTIIAVERHGGALYKVNPDSFERIPCWTTKLTTTEEGEEEETNVDKGWMKTDRYTTGALALWENSDANIKALIVGLQGGLSSSSSSSSYTHGYVEFDLNSDGSLNESTPCRKGSNIQSVLDPDQYTTSLGKHPINHLFQVPKEINEKMIFFASTQTAGLWSYKTRKDSNNKNRYQWNAEAEN